MIKRVLTFVSGVQESVLVDFISQNKVKILHCQTFDEEKFNKSKLVEFSSSKVSLQKRTNLDFFYIFFNFWAAIKILCEVLFDFKLLK